MMVGCWALGRVGDLVWVTAGYWAIGRGCDLVWMTVGYWAIGRARDSACRLAGGSALMTAQRMMTAHLRV